MNVLITSAGRRVSLTKAFQAEIRQFFPNGRVICVDSVPDLSSACQVADTKFNVPPITSNSYIESIIDIAINNNVKIIIPTVDTELISLAESRELFLSRDISCIISDIDIINTFSKKHLTNDFFESVNIGHPLEYDRNKLKFPVFIKPNDGSSSKGVLLVKTKEDLMPSLWNDPSLIFLEYINPDNFDEYTVDLYYSKESELKCIVPRKRIEVRGGEVSKSLTQRNILVDYLFKRLKNIKGVRGCINIQLFLQKNGSRIYGIEVNPRFGGGYPLSYLAGANYPRWIIEEYLFDKKLTFSDRWESNLLMLRYDAEIIRHDFRS